MNFEQAWWKKLPDERIWLETTNRSDLGADLNAPKVDENGHEHWTYEILKEVSEQDIVLHYDINEGAITSWSRATGTWYDDTVFWGARAAIGKRYGVTPYARPGRRLGLEGPFRLVVPPTLDALRAARAAIEVVHSDLQKSHPRESLYFPFELSAKRELRPAQAYLTKFPSALLLSIPGLEELSGGAGALSPSQSTKGLGQQYRRINEDVASSTRNPFAVDPDVVDRGLRGHRSTQNALADALRARDIEPRSPRSDEPQFDLAWEADGAIFVVEVKSLTDVNEEKQLRLALGQVLRYAQLLTTDGRQARPIIAAERQPSDSAWVDLCQQLGVLLIWQDTFEKGLADLSEGVSG